LRSQRLVKDVTKVRQQEEEGRREVQTGYELIYKLKYGWFFVDYLEFDMELK